MRRRWQYRGDGIVDKSWSWGNLWCIIIGSVPYNLHTIFLQILWISISRYSLVWSKICDNFFLLLYISWIVWTKCCKRPYTELPSQIISRHVVYSWCMVLTRIFVQRVASLLHKQEQKMYKRCSKVSWLINCSCYCAIKILYCTGYVELQTFGFLNV